MRFISVQTTSKAVAVKGLRKTGWKAAYFRTLIATSQSLGFQRAGISGDWGLRM